MKDLVQKMKSFIFFDFPLETSNITAQFSDTQQKFQLETPGWSTSATKQKLISHYWFSNVSRHFALILAIPILIICISTAKLEQRFLLSIFMAGFLSFPVIYFFVYRPYFGSTYLPRLETVKEIYEKKELQDIEKCRRAQLSNQALCLIFYVFDQTSGIHAIQPNDHFAGILSKLYGVDRGSMKTNLELILGNSCKRVHLTDRKRTEIINRFAEAYNFLQDLNFSNGIALLKKLESKFLAI